LDSAGGDAAPKPEVKKASRWPYTLGLGLLVLACLVVAGLVLFK
jgi:hypothetical protein